jgi:hypothetical protein
MALLSINDTTLGPVTVWSDGAINPFGHVNLSTGPEFAWDGIYGSGGDLTITLSSADGRTDIGSLTDPTTGFTLGFKWDAATNTFTQHSYNGPHPGPLQGAGSLLRGLLYTAPTLALGETLTVQAKISFSSEQLTTVNDYPTPNKPTIVTITDPKPIVMQVRGERLTSGPAQIGVGPDSFTFSVSEDAYQGDAQFLLTVDGKQYGGVQTVTALHAAGQTQRFTVKGDFGAASPHTVAIQFLNDAYGGSDGIDRNLYVDLVSFNDSTLGITPIKGSLFTDGSLTFMRPGTGPDKLVVSLNEDAYQGDAQAEITLDGKVLGQVTVTAPHPGTPQDFAFTGSFGAGPHTLGVNFLNDAYGGSDATDRNVYVSGASLNGVAHPGITGSLFTEGNASFAFS